MESGGSAPPPPPAQQPPPPPPPQQGWQSTPTPPGPPPAGGGQPSGMPTWTNNITARGTIAGPGNAALADLPERIIAYVIDAIILGLISIVINFILGSILVETRTDFVLGIPIVTRGPTFLATVISLLLTLGISAGYFIYMWTRMGGATVGMRVLKLGVRDATTGQIINQQQAIRRWAYIGLPGALGLGYGLPVIGFILALVVLGYYIYLLVTTAQSPTRQGFHDKGANTVVAKLAA